MEKLKKSRGVRRGGFTKLYNALSGKLSEENRDDPQISALLKTLQEKFEEVRRLDESIFEGMVDDDAEVEDLEAENEAADEFIRKYHYICSLAQSKSTSNETEDYGSVSGNSVNHQTSIASKRKFKLPQVELKKFGGDVRDWLPFWSQFQQIDEDGSLDPADKINYLWQATIAGSRARQLVASYPQTRENYPKVVEALKARFGRQDLLVEVYVRELLKLVIINTRKINNTPLSELFDTLKAHLRALESLDVAPESCAAILFPLVESCLPEDLLRVWQRSRLLRDDEDDEAESSAAKKKLPSLMRFIQREVEGEEKITLAMAGFDRTTDKQKPPERRVEERKATAASLLANSSGSCIFCNENHSPVFCSKASKMPFDEKRKVVITKKCCFICLTPGHVVRWCKAKISCNHCQKRHATSMCTEGTEIEKSTSKPRTEQALAAVSSQSTVLLQTVQVLLVGEKGERRVRALFDSGSQRSYLLSDTAERLGYVAQRREKLTHSLFGGMTTKESIHSVYRARVYSLESNNAYNFDVLSQAIIAGTIGGIPTGPWTEELREKKISLSDDTEGPIELLLGADVMGHFTKGRRLKLSSGIFATETTLGWTLMGKAKGVTHHNDAALLTHSLLCSNDVLTLFWDLETMGIKDASEKQTKEARLADVNKFFDATVERKEDGRYVVRLPWREGVGYPSNTRELALQRTRSKNQRLTAQRRVSTYLQVFKEWLLEGIIEKAPPLVPRELVYYLPHRPVFKAESTTKIRPVFDASAKVAGSRALNDCLEVGENLIELIPNILLRFRRREMGVSADIKKAFLQIEVAPEDRNVLRFFLPEDNVDATEYRHARLVFGLCCSPFILGAVIRDLVLRTIKEREADNNELPVDVLKSLLSSFYVDNFLSSVSNRKELEEVRAVATKTLARGQFDLRGWESTTDERSLDDCPLSKVFGMTWNRERDALSICVERLDELDTRKVTKRLILSVAQRIFDPIGFTAPTTLIPKTLLQKLWRMKLRWDEEVDSETADCFLTWFKTLPALTQIEIPRWAFGRVEDQITYHVFVDASSEAYAAAIFSRVEMSSGSTFCRLICAKSRVCPLKTTTIPRLELLAATLGVRLFDSMVQALELNTVEAHFWTDSSTVLAWIQRDRVWGVFVQNRVEEIRRLAPRERWRHVSGTLNPADFPSRGGSAARLLRSRWWEGPEWLRGLPTSWPSPTDIIFNEDEVLNERRKGVINLAVRSKSVSNSDWYYRKFSRFSQNVRMMAWALRFVHNCRNREHRAGELTTVECLRAEIVIFRLIQNEGINGASDPRLHRGVVQTDAEGLLRLRSRLMARGEEEDEFTRPIILPGDHVLVRRLVFEVHCRDHHVGTQCLTSRLRHKYWILGGRRAVRQVVKSCVRCRRFTGQKEKTAGTDLPRERVCEGRPFDRVGVDFFGPCILLDGSKVWGCLFTCTVVRSVHLELTDTLSTNGFLQALRRFIARRGRPTVIFSDNGTNFRGTHNLLKEIDWQEVIKYGTVEKIIWKFSPPSAAWWGGFWERQVRTVKELLRRSLGRASLTYEEMSTVLCECEAIINSRPLTYLSEQPEDLTALTPAMFFIDFGGVTTADLDCVDAQHLRRRYKYRQRLREELWRRFRDEYLGNLRSMVGDGSADEPGWREGELVLVEDERTKRLEWPLARVTKLLPGLDGVVRVVELVTTSGKLIRPVRRLIRLELDQPGKRLNENDVLNRQEEKSPHENEQNRSAQSSTDEEDFPPKETTWMGPYAVPNEPISTGEVTSAQPDIPVEPHTRSGRRVHPPVKMNL